MKKYQIIYADPPWEQGKGGKKKVRPNSSGGGLDYPTLPLGSIQQILFNAQLLSDNNHILFLWATEKHLQDAEGIIKNLGYKLHIRMIWNKVTGLATAFTVRYGHEYLLYCFHGKMIPVAKEQRGKWHSVFTERVERHSQKPQLAYEIIESLFPMSTKVELFARHRREGWDCWGNEVEGGIELNPVRKEE